MKVRMLRQIQGLRNGVRYPAIGGELVVDDREGANLCANGYAEPVAVVAEPEKRPAPEAAEKRPARRAAK